jgi:ornithine cyclodeaminase/alanine dehydrogenase-like protein (mu-crystallin family)
MFSLNYLNGIKFEKKKFDRFRKYYVFFFLKIYLWSRNIKHAIDLQSNYSSKLNNIEILKDLNDIHLQESNVICTCTASEEALFGLKQVKKGVHINGNSEFERIYK